MLSAHITSFLNLIMAQLEEAARGVMSIHHFHNVQCGIDNILCLLEYNGDVVDKAINSHAEPPAISHATIGSHRRSVMGTSAMMLIASARPMRRLPVSVSRWNTVSRILGLADWTGVTSRGSPFPHEEVGFYERAQAQAHSMIRNPP